MIISILTDTFHRFNHRREWTRGHIVPIALLARNKSSISENLREFANDIGVTEGLILDCLDNLLTDGVSLLALRTGHALLSRDVIFLILLLISIRG
jgi:hypothetical protein